MKKIIYILIIIIATISCNNHPVNQKDDKEFPVLLNVEKTTNKIKIDSTIRKSTSNILYIGKLKDSIKLNYTYHDFPFGPPPPPPEKMSKADSIEWRNIIDPFVKSFKEHPIYPYYRELEYKEEYIGWNKAKMLIEVDTSTITKQLVDYGYSEGKFHPAYPVLIQNLEKDTIQIGYDRFIPIILEAKDSTGTWKPIENMFRFMCGMGIGSIILPPKEIVITSKRFFNGKYSTILRIKLGTNYSNTFNGTINYSQFENPVY